MAIPFVARAGSPGWAALLIGLALLEVAVLGCNRGRCPLTDVAARFTDDRTPNFDIYLPRVLARWHKAIFGTIYLNPRGAQPLHGLARLRAGASATAKTAPPFA